MYRRKQIHGPPRPMPKNYTPQGSKRPAKGSSKTSFLFAMEYKTEESTGRWFSSKWLLITFTHLGKCIACDCSARAARF
jgi:hypothetical protein